MSGLLEAAAAKRQGRAGRALVIAALVLLTVGCDQVTKYLARMHLPGRGTVAVVDSVLVLQYAENEGAFLGLGSRLPPPVRTGILVALPLAALAAIVVSMLRARTLSWLLLTGLSLIAGGGLGNLLDRLLRGGRVSDFLNLGIGNLRTGIFNIADFAVLVGCVLLLLSPGDRPRRAAGPPGEGDTPRDRDSGRIQPGDRGSGRIQPGDRDSGRIPPTS